MSEAHAGPLAHHFRDLEQQKEAASLGMWLFIAQEILFFGGPLRAPTPSTATSTTRPSPRAATTCPGSSASSTPSSSSAAASPWPWACYSAAIGRRRAIVGWILATILLGGVFLGVKYVEYGEKIAPCFGDGPHVGCLVPGARFDAGALHLDGAGARRGADLLLALLRDDRPARPPHDHRHPDPVARSPGTAWNGRYTPAWHTPVEMVGLYWHFVDIVWIFLFPLLYLIGHH